MTIYARIKSVSENLNGKKLLHLGCSHGLFLDYLKVCEPKLETVGIDICPEAVKLGRELGLNIKKINAKAIPFENEFDFIVSESFITLTYFRENDIKKIIKECEKALKLGGYLVIQNWTEFEDELIQIGKSTTNLKYEKELSRFEKGTVTYEFNQPRLFFEKNRIDNLISWCVVVLLRWLS